MADGQDMEIDTAKWSGEGEFTARLLEQLKQVAAIRAIRVEDAPATRSEADYNFISNEVFIVFNQVARREPIKRFGFLPGSRTVMEKLMTLPALEATLATMPEVGVPDYGDEAMLQFLKAERIVPPYQTRGYKLVELVRIYEAPATPASA